MVAASPAGAYEIDPEAKPRWPFDKLTYVVAQTDGANPDGSTKYKDATPAQIRAVARGMRAWTRAGVGWWLERVDSRAEAEADILFLLNPRHRFRNCQGLGTRGFGFGQALVGLRGRCGRGQLLSLIAAHELGHVLGLGDENRECAVMNQGYSRLAGRIRPAKCTDPGAERGGLIRADDRRGARALYRREFAYARALCDPLDELPVLATNAPCRYTFDCRGKAGDQLIDDDGDGITEPEKTVDLMIRDCERRLRVARWRREASIHAAPRLRRRGRRRLLGAHLPGRGD